MNEAAAELRSVIRSLVIREINRWHQPDVEVEDLEQTWKDLISYLDEVSNQKLGKARYQYLDLVYDLQFSDSEIDIKVKDSELGQVEIEAMIKNGLLFMKDDDREKFRPFPHDEYESPEQVVQSLRNFSDQNKGKSYVQSPYRYHFS